MRPDLLLGMFIACLPAAAWSWPYEDCILKNMKGVTERAAVFAVRQACEVKTTPRKCRDSSPLMQAARERAVAQPGILGSLYDYLDGGEIKIAREQCLKDCATASIWSRNFGDCSTD